jgi:hypothetical protein
LAEEGFAAAQKLGDEVSMGRLVTWVVWDRIEQGRLSDAETLLAELDEMDIAPTDALELNAARLTIGILRGDDYAVEEQVRLAHELLSDPNPTIRDQGRGRTASTYRKLGRLPEALEWLAQYETEESRQFGMMAAAMVALWIGDVEGIRRLRKQNEFADRRESRFVGSRLLLEAGELALSGQTALAGRAFRELIDLWDGKLPPWDVNEVRMLYAALLPEDPPAQEGAELALRWIQESGATRLLTAWRLGARSEPSRVPV